MAEAEVSDGADAREFHELGMLPGIDLMHAIDQAQRSPTPMREAKQTGLTL